MPFSLNLFFLALIIWPVTGFAKLKIYHCQSESGHVVIQDRACRITDLLTGNLISDKLNQKIINNKKPQLQLPSRQQATFQPNKTQNKQPKQFIEQINSEKWQPQLTSNIHGWQLALSINSSAKFNKTDAAIKIDFYPDTNKSFGQDAFAQALDFYHELRNKHQLQDSQFVSHPDYKIFNVSYRAYGERAYTEYFMAKNRPELYVITVKTNNKNWPLIWSDFVKIKSVL